MRSWTLALAVLLAGCTVGPAITCASGWSADLERDPSTYGALARIGEERTREQLGAPGGAPFENATLRGRWGDYWLQSIEKRAENETWWIVGRVPHTVRGSVPADRTPAQVIESHATFAAELTDLAPDEVRDARYISRRSYAETGANGDDPFDAFPPGEARDRVQIEMGRGVERAWSWRIEDAWDARFDDVPPPAGGVQIGTYHVEDGDWTFVFSLPQRFARTTDGDARMHMSTDTAGQAHAWLFTSRRVLDADEGRAEMDAALDRLGVKARPARFGPEPCT